MIAEAFLKVFFEVNILLKQGIIGEAKQEVVLSLRNNFLFVHDMVILDCVSSKEEFVDGSDDDVVQLDELIEVFTLGYLSLKLIEKLFSKQIYCYHVDLINNNQGSQGDYQPNYLIGRLLLTGQQV